ncbi:MAG: hydroxymethylbilane synthase, partial [Flavobacteriales bacterium]
MNRELTIGTRGSDLALWQANSVRQWLEKLGYTCHLKIIQTKGD